MLVASSSVLAQGAVCKERGELLRELEDKFGEVVEHSAVAKTGKLVEWTVAPDGSWSMLVTSSDGRACLIWWGDGWRDNKKVKGVVA